MFNHIAVTNLGANQIKALRFEKPFKAMTQLAEELAPECDPHMLAISMAGLVLFHFESAPVRQFLPGGLQGHDQPEVIAQHVIRLLTRAVDH